MNRERVRILGHPRDLAAVLVSEFEVVLRRHRVLPRRGPRPSPLISILVKSRGRESCARNLTAVRDGPRMTLGGRKVVVLAEDGYEDLELWVPYYRLVEEGAEGVLAGHEKRTYTSKHSYPCEVDVTAATLKAKDFDAVVIPGGVAGPDRMRQHKEILSFVRSMGGACFVAPRFSSDVVTPGASSCFFPPSVGAT